MTPRQRFVARAAAFGAAALFGARVTWAVAPLPPSERLDPVRPAVQKIVDQAESAGIPADLIVSKVREGVAKGVAPETIRAVAEQMARELGEANAFLRAHRKTGASAGLVRGLAEVRSSGVELAATLPLVASSARDAQVQRGLEAVTDLGLRGYPGTRAAFVVSQVLERDPEAVGHVVAGIESIRRAQTMSRADALDTLSKNLGSGSFEAALNRSLEGSEHSANGAGNGKSGQASEHGNGVAGTKKNMGMKNK